MNHLLITSEILLTVVAPLLVLYLKGNWKHQTMIVCMCAIPVLWYFVYAPIHELSHLLGAYLVGGDVTEVKLIPRFWAGEVAGAWIRLEGVTNKWSQFLFTGAPYVLDVVSVAIGYVVLHRTLSQHGFLIGFLFMLLCLRPAFDLLCETVSFATGFRGDLFHLALTAGNVVTWTFLALAIMFSIAVIVLVLRRFRGFPQETAAATT